MSADQHARRSDPGPAGSDVTTMDPGAGYLVVIDAYASASDRPEAVLACWCVLPGEGFRHVPDFRQMPDRPRAG